MVNPPSPSPPPEPFNFNPPPEPFPKVPRRMNSTTKTKIKLKTTITTNHTTSPNSILTSYYLNRLPFILLYFTLLLVRGYLGLIAKGYTHPDEYFQGGEIVAREVLGVDTKIPWEFDPTFPCRSIIFPYLFVSPPFYLLRYLSRSTTWGVELLTASHLFKAVRLTFTLYSLVLDYCLYRSAGTHKRYGRGLLLLWSTSYLHIAYFTHSFSNCAEALLLTLTFTVAFSLYWTPRKNGTTLNSHYRRQLLLCLVLGVIVAIGVTTRVTFLAFLFPLAVEAFVKSSKLRFRWPQRLVGNQLTLDLVLLASFLTTLGGIIVIDSLYFGSLRVLIHGTPLTMTTFLSHLNWEGIRNWEFQGELVSTTLNHLRYNADSENLKEHGLHPRVLHLLVNTPLLFLPMLLGLLLNLKERPMDFRVRIMLETILCGTLVLSLVPHQEPRFLLPLSFPYLYLSKPLLRLDTKKLMGSWLTFNLLLGFFYGGLHQAGVVPLLNSLQGQLDTFNQCKVMDYHPDTHQGTVLCSGGDRREGNFYVSPCDAYQTHVLGHKVFMLPRHLILPSPHLTTNGKFRPNHKVTVEDLIGYDNAQARRRMADLQPPRIDPHHPPPDLQNQYWHLSVDPESEKTACTRVILVTTAPRIAPWDAFESHPPVLHYSPLSPSRFELAVYRPLGGSLTSFLECIALIHPSPLSPCLTCPVAIRHFDPAPYLTQPRHLNTDEFDSVFAYYASTTPDYPSPLHLYARQITRHPFPTITPPSHLTLLSRPSSSSSRPLLFSHRSPLLHRWGTQLYHPPPSRRHHHH